MSIRFVKLLVSIIWRNRDNDTKCMTELLQAFGTYGNPYANSLLDYLQWDNQYENKVFFFDTKSIHMIWRKDVK